MGAYLSSPVTEKEQFSGASRLLEYGGASMQGWRRSMEDAHIAVLGLGDNADTAMFAVFDGHGGSEVARFCQRYMAEELPKLEHYRHGRLRDGLIEVFHKIDGMLRDETYARELTALKQGARPPALQDAAAAAADSTDGDQPSEVNTVEAMALLRKMLAIRKQGGEAAAVAARAGAGEGGGAPPAREATAPLTSADPTIQAGCTAVVAVVQGGRLVVANAGDSRAVLCRGRAALPLSEDHKPGSEAERARITAAGGFVSDVGGVVRVNGNLNLSRAIGDLRYKGNEALPPADQIISAQPDVRELALTPEDWFLVLACDGVWDVLSNQEVCDFVAQRLQRGRPPAEAAAELLDACLASDPAETRGIGCDNMTATIVVLRPGGA